MRLLIYTQTIDVHDPVLGFFHRWVAEFAKHFEHVYVICLKEGEHTLPQNVSVYSLGKETGEHRLKYIVRFYRYSIRILLFSRPNFVLFHMGAIYNVLAAPFFLVRNFLGTQYYWWKTHGKMSHLKEKLALWFCDRVFTAGSRSFGLKTEKVSVVGHAIDTELFVPLEHATRDAESILVVGRVTPIKKIEIALSAVRRMNEPEPRVRLDIIGNPDDLSYKKRLETQISGQNISRVTFTEGCSQKELVGRYQRANILLHPAYEAGFDKVVLEAMATGVLPLTSIPSFREILEPFGLYIEKNDTEGYGEAIQRIMQMKIEDREQLARELRRIVVRDHSIETMPKRLFGV